MVDILKLWDGFDLFVLSITLLEYSSDSTRVFLSLGTERFNALDYR